MKFSPKAITAITLHCTLVRSILALASTSCSSSALCSSSISRSLPPRFGHVGERTTRPFISSSSSSVLLSNIQRGGSNNNESSSSTSLSVSSASSEAAPITPSDNDDSNDDELSANTQKQLLLEKCIELGISSALTTSTFGGLSYTYLQQQQKDNKKSKQHHKVLFILGGPGAGKGTQCENIVENYKCIHLSVGELLRNAKTQEDNPYRELIEERLVAGQIVPVEISLALLRDAMDKATSSSFDAPLFLVDGFPRNYDNLAGWVKNMPDYATVLGALVFNCPEQELERRILSRGETSGRSDDNLISAKKRFKTFQDQTMPVVEVLNDLEDVSFLRVSQIAGENSIGEVWSDTQKCMDEYVMGDVLKANQDLLDAIEEKDVEKYVDLVNVQMLSDEEGHLRISSDDNEENQKEDEKNAKEEKDNSSSSSSSVLEYAQKEMNDLEIVQECGDGKQVNKISNANVLFHDGTSVTVSYDREISLVSAVPESEKTDDVGAGELLTKVHETRVWKHGPKGWVNVHFIRGEV